MKKALSILIAVLLLLSLTACGAKMESAATEDMAFSEAPAETPAGGESGWYAKPEAEEIFEDEVTETTASQSDSNTTDETIAEKIIYSANIFCY